MYSLQLTQNYLTSYFNIIIWYSSLGENHNFTFDNIIPQTNTGMTIIRVSFLGIIAPSRPTSASLCDDAQH